jgi:hypothetical protein
MMMRQLPLIVCVLFSLVRAQAVIDHIEVHDVVGVPTLAEIHIASVPDWAACVASETIMTCDHILTRFYLPEDAAEPLSDELRDLEREFRKKVAKEIDAEVNKKPPCYVPPVCAPVPQPVPVPDPVCIATRVATGLANGLAKYEAQYWLDVTAAMYEYLPNTIAWNAPMPVGMLFAPIFSLTPKLEQYFLRYSDDPRELPYMEQGVPPHIFVPLPITPEEADILHPGINPLEPIKAQWATASYLEYQNFGFSSFYQLRTEIRPMLFFGSDIFPPNIYPGIQMYCTAVIIPYVPLPIKLPLTVMPPMPTAVTGVLSVAEGYEIPGTIGRPFFP